MSDRDGWQPGGVGNFQLGQVSGPELLLVFAQLRQITPGEDPSVVAVIEADSNRVVANLLDTFYCNVFFTRLQNPLLAAVATYFSRRGEDSEQLHRECATPTLEGDFKRIRPRRKFHRIDRWRLTTISVWVVEDCDGWTLARVADEFGSEVHDLIAPLTDPEGESWEIRKEYGIEKAASMDVRCATVKAADKLHNLSSLVAAVRAASSAEEAWKPFSRGKETTLAARGRHDPCVLPRAVPIVESMAALVLADLALIQKSRG